MLCSKSFSLKIIFSQYTACALVCYIYTMLVSSSVIVVQSELNIILPCLLNGDANRASRAHKCRQNYTYSHSSSRYDFSVLQNPRERAFTTRHLVHLDQANGKLCQRLVGCWWRRGGGGGGGSHVNANGSDGDTAKSSERASTHRTRRWPL